MVVVGVHLKKKKHPLQSEAATLPPLHHSYSSCTCGNIGILKWRNWIRGRKKKSFIFVFHNKVASSIKTGCQRNPGEREIPKLCTYSLEIWCACSHFQFLSSFFNPQNTLITKMTNFPRVVEWGCLVMLLPTQVSQQTSGDSICFLSDLRARWEPSCILTKPEICKHKQRTNFPSVSLLFSSKRCLPEPRCFDPWNAAKAQETQQY